MAILFILGVLLLGYILVNTMGPALKEEKPCKPHKWVLKMPPDETGYLICKACGKQPGQHD